MRTKTYFFLFFFLISTVVVFGDITKLTFENTNYSEYCGDFICNNGETCSTCSIDCGSCTSSGSGLPDDDLGAGDFVASGDDWGVVVDDDFNFVVVDVENVSFVNVSKNSSVGVFISPVVVVFPSLPCEFVIKTFGGYYRGLSVDFWVSTNPFSNISLFGGSKEFLVGFDKPFFGGEEFVALFPGDYWCNVRVFDGGVEVVSVSSLVQSVGRFHDFFALFSGFWDWVDEGWYNPGTIGVGLFLFVVFVVLLLSLLIYKKKRNIITD